MNINIYICSKKRYIAMKTVIFDLDGTLLNTLDDLHNSVAFALKKADLPPIDKMDTRRFLGNGVKNLIEKCVGHVAPDAGQATMDDVLKIFKNHYVEHSMEKTAPYEGVDNMLKACKETGIHTAIVSNKLDAAVQDLYRKFFDQWVDLAIGETASMKRKPAPDMVEEAIKRLSDKCGMKINKDNCVYVGDSEVDLQTAKNAGIRCVAVSWGFRDRDWLIECGAQCIINKPEELLSIL